MSADHYRRLETPKIFVRALKGFNEKEIVEFSEMPEIEKWVLNRVAQLYKKIKDDSENFRLNDIQRCIFYFDIRYFYCASIDSLERRSYRTVLDILFMFFNYMVSAHFYVLHLKKHGKLVTMILKTQFISKIIYINKDLMI